MPAEHPPLLNYARPIAREAFWKGIADIWPRMVIAALVVLIALVLFADFFRPQWLFHGRMPQVIQTAL